MASVSVKKDGSESSDDERGGGSSIESLSDWLSECRNSSTSSSRSSFEFKAKECSSSMPAPVAWPLPKPPPPFCVKTAEHLYLKKQESKLSETEREMMKGRFAKLLLGEDMSGSGRGVCSALALSNAITNLYAAVFGQLWRLEPLPSEKKLMWQREMEFLLSVSGHIVELIPSVQTFPDGTKLEVMTSRARSDMLINLPALRKLDSLLIEILDSFVQVEHWYIDQGLIAPKFDGSTSFRQSAQLQEEKWWLPVPRVPPAGLLEDTRKKIIQKRDCAAQILKAAMAINSNTLAEMDVPESYTESLPKNGRSCLGDIIHRYMTSEEFSSDCLLDCLDLSSEHLVLELADRVEASIYASRRRIHRSAQLNASGSVAKSSWGMVKDIMIEGGDKRELLAQRAEHLLRCLKQRFPGLNQTSLDATKIQCNKDVGKAILESYSRILESLAFNMVSRIDDLLYVDDLTRHPKSSISSAPRIIAQKKVGVPYSVSISGTLFATAFSTPSFSPAPLTSQPFLFCNNNKQGTGFKRALTNRLVGEETENNCSNLFEGLGLMANRNAEIIAARNSLEVLEWSKESSSRK